MQEIADRYWTENTGQRAPDDGYTNFWDSKEDNSEIADLFSGDEGKSDTSVPSDASPEQAAPEASTEEPSP